jgi:hypothetical protein
LPQLGGPFRSGFGGPGSATNVNASCLSRLDAGCLALLPGLLLHLSDPQEHCSQHATDGPVEVNLLRHSDDILFQTDGPRKAIYLGKVSQRSAESVLARVERLVESKLTGCALDRGTAEWVGTLIPKLAMELVTVG